MLIEKFKIQPDVSNKEKFKIKFKMNENMLSEEESNEQRIAKESIPQRTVSFTIKLASNSQKQEQENLERQNNQKSDDVE